MSCIISDHSVLSAIYWTALASPSEEAGHSSFYVKKWKGCVKQIKKNAIRLSAALRVFESKLRIERKK